jgi:acetyl-CoA acetyltransferase
VNSSSIGLGHPVGSTGCRIMVTLLYAIKKRGKNLGLATLCGGGVSMRHGNVLDGQHHRIGADDANI